MCKSCGKRQRCPVDETRVKFEMRARQTKDVDWPTGSDLGPCADNMVCLRIMGAASVYLLAGRVCRFGCTLQIICLKIHYPEKKEVSMLEYELLNLICRQIAHTATSRNTRE